MVRSLAPLPSITIILFASNAIWLTRRFAIGKHQMVTGVAGVFFLTVQLILQWRVFDIVNRDVYRNLSLKSQNMI